MHPIRIRDFIMKKFILLFSIVVIAVNVMAYQPMLIEGRLWTIRVYEEPIEYNFRAAKNDTMIYRIAGDTMINEQIYKVIQLSQSDHKFLMRENIEEQKIWMFNTETNTEKLVADFKLNVGDSLNIINETNETVCENILYIKDNEGNILKKVTFVGNITFTLVEGYGFENITFNDDLGYKAYMNILSVTYENDTLIDFTKEIEYYSPIVVEGYSWNVVNRNAYFTETNITEYYTYSEKIEGDSTISGIVYKKLWRSTNEEMTEYEVIAFVREDIENQKVWSYIGEKEYLIYDFACKIGDKVTTLKSLQSAESQVEEVEMTIKAIEKIEDLGGAKYDKYIATIENQDIVYYERFGSENGWYSRSYDGIIGGGINFMICAFDTIRELEIKPVYNNELDEIKNCYINEIKTAVEDVTISNISLKKVIHNGQFYIIHEGRIYNVMGVEEKNINWDFENSY